MSIPNLAPLLVNATTASRMLATSPRTLWSLTQRGEVPCVRIGRSVRYALADLEKYIARLRDAQPAQTNGRPVV